MNKNRAFGEACGLVLGKAKTEAEARAMITKARELLKPDGADSFMRCTVEPALRERFGDWREEFAKIMNTNTQPERTISMSDEPEEQQPEFPIPIDARIEFTTKDGGFITAQIHALDDTENLSVVFVRFIGRHLQSLTDMAMREHRNAKELVAANEQVAMSMVGAAEAERRDK